MDGSAYEWKTPTRAMKRSFKASSFCDTEPLKWHAVNTETGLSACEFAPKYGWCIDGDEPRKHCTFCERTLAGKKGRMPERITGKKVPTDRTAPRLADGYPDWYPPMGKPKL